MWKLILLLTVLTVSGTALANERLVSLRFDNAPLVLVLDQYAEFTGKKVEVVSGVHGSFTFSTETKYTWAEAVEMLERKLRSQNIGLYGIGSNRVVATWLDPSKAPSKTRSSSSNQNRTITRTGRPVNSPTPTYTGEELKKHLQNYQMEVIRRGLPPLPIPIIEDEVGE